MVNVHVPSRSKAWPVKTSRGQLWPVETSRCHPSADKPTAITPSSTRGRADGSRVRGSAPKRPELVPFARVPISQNILLEIVSKK